MLYFLNTSLKLFTSYKVTIIIISVTFKDHFENTEPIVNVKRAKRKYVHEDRKFQKQDDASVSAGNFMLFVPLKVHISIQT